ncbi:MAG: ATP-grasp domain-containing protein [Oscillospiraceae bacterium]|nr:ATP-grasp domain-containing protein [Oscillospiraceae bacterium]
MAISNIQPLLFGGDINVYSVARAFHEAYGVKSIAFGKFVSFPCAYSDIIDYRPCPDNEDPATFLHNVEQVAAECGDRNVVLVGCGDSYVKLAAHLRSQFPPNVKCNYISGAMMDMLTDKERFYALCDKYGIDHPATFVYEGSMGHDFDLPWEPPYVAKPADGVAYWATGHNELKKVYICSDREELLAALDEVYAAGYPGKMILQEFIPGDDSYMRVLTNYSDTHGKVKLMCLGHVLLEEHSPHGIGNHAVIITEHDRPLCDRIRAMLEDLGYVGFSNFDIKYDRRDGKYKAFEINTRQGRSNYYVTGSGHNIARYLVDDLLEGKDLPLTVVEEETIWRMIPRRLALANTPKSYHARMKKLFRRGTDHHSMEYRPDYTPRRIWRIWKNHIGTYVRFHKYPPKIGD